MLTYRNSYGEAIDKDKKEYAQRLLQKGGTNHVSEHVRIFFLYAEAMHTGPQVHKDVRSTQCMRRSTYRVIQKRPNLRSWLPPAASPTNRPTAM